MEFLLAIGLFLFFTIAASASEPAMVRWQGRTMGSPYTVQVVGMSPEDPGLDKLKAQIEETLKEVNRQMSHYDPESELSRFNRMPANTPFRVSADFASVVRFTLALCEQTGGVLDPTLTPVINLWGFGEKSTNRVVPADAELKVALAETGFKHLSVTAKDELVKDIPGLTLNFSAVAKGFGVDKMIEVLGKNGWTNVYASIAGEVRVMGRNSRGTAWQIGVSEPVSNWREKDPMAGVVSLLDGAISTSGDYQKFFFDEKGLRLAHIFDARTGCPVRHNVAGVSVIAADSMTADALSTTLFVMGLKDGLNFIDKITNAAALYILREENGSFRKVESKRFRELTTKPQ